MWLMVLGRNSALTGEVNPATVNLHDAIAARQAILQMRCLLSGVRISWFPDERNACPKACQSNLKRRPQSGGVNIEGLMDF